MVVVVVLEVLLVVVVVDCSCGLVLGEASSEGTSPSFHSPP